MRNWIERARELKAGAGSDNSDITDNSPPNVAIVPIVSATVSPFPPPDIARGLAHLRTMPVPRGVIRDNWRRVVTDAGRLVSEGWAAEAFERGWTALDLFGSEPVGSDDDYKAGLAAWLTGRPLVLLDADSAIARINGKRWVFNKRRDRSGCVLLWELGR